MNIKLNDKHIAGRNQFTYFVNIVKSTTTIQTFIALFVILIFAGINIISVLRDFSLTTDEDKHLLYGENVLSGNPTRFDDSKMPVTALNVLPKKMATLLGDERLIYFGSKLYIARMVTIFFSCLVAFLVFHWARLLYGFVPSIFSLLLYVLDPNIIAHSQLATTDLYITGSIIFAFFTLWKFANERNLSNGLLCLFALGISQIAKYTAVVLFPLFLITLLIFDLSTRSRHLMLMETIRVFGLRYIKYAASAIMASILIINLGFLFNRTFTSFGEYQFRSRTFQNMQADFPALGFLPVPVPYPYLEGLDYMRNTEQTGSLSGNVYFLGQISTLKGFPGYYIVASLLKVPIATQIILILAQWVYFTRRDCRDKLFKNEIFLLTPVLFFTIYFNFFFNTQIGIRYYLPVFPLLYVFSGNLFTGWADFPSLRKALSWGLIAYLFISVFSYYPYCLSYFNEFVWNRTQAYKYLADSNIDWEQGKNELWQYVSEHPNVIYSPQKVRSGLIVVGVNDLVGVTVDPDQYAWLRDNFEPVDTIAYSYLVYKIDRKDIDALCATTTYCDR